LNANDIVNELDRLGVWIQLVSGPGPGPTIVVDAPAGAIDDDLAEAIRSNRTMVINVLLGRRTGHVFAACNKCGLETMVHVGRPVRACRMTTGCDGRHELPEEHHAADTKPPKEAPLPPRPPKSRAPGDQRPRDNT